MTNKNKILVCGAGRSTSIGNIIKFYDDTIIIRIKELSYNGLMLRNMRDIQTESMCLTAVRQNGLALKYVDNQTEKICLEAVKQNGLALRYVKEQTPDICLAAIHENSESMKYMEKGMLDNIPMERIIPVYISSKQLGSYYISEDMVKKYK